MVQKKEYDVRTRGGKARAQGGVKTTSGEDRMAKTATVQREGQGGRLVLKKDSGDVEIVTAHSKTPATVKSIVAKRRDALKQLANRG